MACKQRFPLAGRQVGPVTVPDFPDDHPAQTCIAGVTDFGLAGVRVIESDEHVIG